MGEWVLYMIIQIHYPLVKIYSTKVDKTRVTENESCSFSLLGGNCIVDASVQSHFQYHLWLLFSILINIIFFVHHDSFIII